MESTAGMTKEAATQRENINLLDGLQSNDHGMRKQAIEATDEYIRKRLYENGFLRSGVLPPIPIGPEDLDALVDSDEPARIFEIENDSPGAVTVPFDTSPPRFYMGMRKFMVRMNRIMSHTHEIDVARAMTYRSPIRDVFSDLALKEILTIEDARFIRAVNSALVSAGATTATGSVQWTTAGAQISRDSVIDSLGVMPVTNRRLVPKTMLMSYRTSLEFKKWGRDEVGGDVAQSTLLGDSTFDGINNTKMIVTIKNDLVPDGSVYFFAEPKYFGKHLMLNDATLHTEDKANMISFFFWMTSGLAIANVGAVTRTDFTITTPA